MSTFDILLDIVKGISPDTSVDLDTVTPDMRIVEDIGLNSIGIMYLVLAIEQEFDVVLHNASIETFKTIQDVIDFIEENK